MQSDLANSRTFKDPWNKIQGLSSTCPVIKHFQGLKFRRKKFKYFQGCVGTLDHRNKCRCSHLDFSFNNIHDYGVCKPQTSNSVMFTQVAAAREDADVVNGDASKHVSKLRNKHQLQWMTTSQCQHATSPHSTCNVNFNIDSTFSYSYQSLVTHTHFWLQLAQFFCVF